MAKIERFEDILAWQKARELNAAIYKLTSQGRLARDFCLRDQMRRASISVMANIAEGFGRKSKREFANFLNMSHGSAAEIQCHIYSSLDLNYISQSFKMIYDHVEEVSKMIQGLMNYLNNS